jgi:hypothetical protein
MGESEEDRITSLVRPPGLEDRVDLNPLVGGIVSDRELNLLYNACDVGINTSMGEGWGLVSFEHGAAGAAQVFPDHTACTELWSGRAELIPPARSYTPAFSVLEVAGCPRRALLKPWTISTKIHASASNWLKRRSRPRAIPNTRGTPSRSGSTPCSSRWRDDWTTGDERIHERFPQRARSLHEKLETGRDRMRRTGVG